jgi:DNA-binding CsgD family transcriptional regulator
VIVLKNYVGGLYVDHGRVKLFIILEAQLNDFNLTARELDIIKLWIRDFTYKEIALTLSISDSTVRKHIDNVYTKLNVYSKSGLILHIINKIVVENTTTV